MSGALLSSAKRPPAASHTARAERRSESAGPSARCRGPTANPPALAPPTPPLLQGGPTTGRACDEGSVRPCPGAGCGTAHESSGSRRRDGFRQNRGFLDLILREADKHFLLIVTDPLDGASGNQPLFAEDPKARIDHNVLATGIARGLVDLADAAVGGLDVIAAEVLVARVGRIGDCVQSAGRRTCRSFVASPLEPRSPPRLGSSEAGRLVLRVRRRQIVASRTLWSRVR